MKQPSFLAACDPRRIAIFRALQLGDMLCAVPALRALRRAAPDARITLIGLPWAAAFVERYAGLVDRLDVFPGARGFPEQPETDEHLPAFLAKMRGERFDLAIQLHGSGGIANDLLAQFGARAHAGFVQPNETTRADCFIAWPDTLPEPLRYLRLMSALGADTADVTATTDVRLDFPLTVDDNTRYASLAAQAGLEPERLVIVHPGAQLPSRRWPASRFAEVADTLAADGWQIAITGTRDELPLTSRVLGDMRAGALHLAGLTTLGSLGALVAHARLVVCNDTGISHVAAALDMPSVVIASGSDTRRWAPLDHERHRVLADYPPCRPCAFRDCPYGHPCALNIDVETVVHAARAQLARYGTASRAVTTAAAATDVSHAAAARHVSGGTGHAA
jgi:ADP-heptose:LPS heptosyltransferase